MRVCLMRISNKSFALLFLVLLAHFALGMSAAAQGGRGIVSGRIVDSSGAVLQGAKILIEPGDIERVTDSQGEFTVTGINSGTYTITVSFVGLETYSGSLEVKAGAVAPAEPELKVGGQSQ